MTTSILKLSVLASGAVLLDGEEVSLDQLRERIEAQNAARPVIWYYREASEGEPPPEAMQVMKLVVDNRLPISLCSKPDFSDYVDRKGVSHPRYTTWESVVAKVREATSGGKYVALIRPDRSYLLMGTPRRDQMPEHVVQSIEKLVPPQVKRTIAVIADTYFTWMPDGGVPGLQGAAREIPFFGMLMGLGCIGHTVFVFPGVGESLEACCKDADLLIVDEAQIPSLASDWRAKAAAVLRGPQVLVHDRATFKLRAI